MTTRKMVPWTPDRIAWMKDLIGQSGSWQAVAFAMGIEESTARKAATKFGLREARRSTFNVSWTPERLAMLKARREVESDWSVIARDLRCTVGSAAAAWQRYVRPTLTHEPPPPPPPPPKFDPLNTLPILPSLAGWEPPPAVRVIPPARHCLWPDYACSGGLWTDDRGYQKPYCQYHSGICYRRVEDEGKDMAPWVRPRTDVAANAEQT
jgi:hypothetical protein